MIVCEDCGQIITAKTFWLHKHSNYFSMDNDMSEYICDMKPEDVEKFVKEILN